MDTIKTSQGFSFFINIFHYKMLSPAQSLTMNFIICFQPNQNKPKLQFSLTIVLGTALRGMMGERVI